VLPLRILIVDDYEDNAAILAEALEARGHVTRFVVDAESALMEAPTFGPDLAILDILLPDMNGYELARRLHGLPGLEQLCLIAITGFSRNPAEALAAGFHGHVMKPITVDKLEVAIRECLAIAGAVPS
jgi:CheY-like chemotaxis protein